MTVTDPDTNRRINQNRNDVEGAYEKLTKVEQTQDVHTDDARSASARRWLSTRRR